MTIVLILLHYFIDILNKRNIQIQSLDLQA